VHTVVRKSTSGQSYKLKPLLDELVNAGNKEKLRSWHLLLWLPTQRREDGILLECVEGEAGKLRFRLKEAFRCVPLSPHKMFWHHSPSPQVHSNGVM
jgi:hypothetical protein